MYIGDDRWYNIFEYYAKAPLSSDNTDPMNTLAASDCKKTDKDTLFTISKLGWYRDKWRALKIDAFSNDYNMIDDIYAYWIKYTKSLILDPIYSANNHANFFLGRLTQFFLHVAVIKTDDNRVHIRLYAMAYTKENIHHIRRILHNSYCWSNTKFPLWYYHDICYTPDTIPKLLWQYKRSKL